MLGNSCHGGISYLFLHEYLSSYDLAPSLNLSSLPFSFHSGLFSLFIYKLKSRQYVIHWKPLTPLLLQAFPSFAKVCKKQSHLLPLFSHFPFPLNNLYHVIYCFHQSVEIALFTRFQENYKSLSPSSSTKPKHRNHEENDSKPYHNKTV